MTRKLVLTTSLILTLHLIVAPAEDNKSPLPAKTRQPIPGGHQYQQKDDFFHSSTKLVNSKDVDYGAILERRRQAFLDASVANPFFWYSSLTTVLLIILMASYGVRVMDEKRRLWHAAEILADARNDCERAREAAQTAIDKHNRHMTECNRVIEAQLGGRSSPAAIDAAELRSELLRVRGELDNVDGERKALEAKLRAKEELVSNMSTRLTALEKSASALSSTASGRDSATNTRAESEGKLIARINELTQQLEAERQRNRRAKGA